MVTAFVSLDIIKMYLWVSECDYIGVNTKPPNDVHEVHTPCIDRMNNWLIVLFVVVVVGKFFVWVCVCVYIYCGNVFYTYEKKTETINSVCLNKMESRN